MSKTTTPVEIKPARAAAPDVWSALRSEMDRMFDRLKVAPFGGFPKLFEGNDFAAPAVDITENDQAYIITAELPGMDEKDVDVTVTEDSLVMKGEKRQEKEEKGKNTYVSERSYGAFQRVFALPAGVDRNKVAADFRKGVLTITLPKTQEAQKQQKKVEIKAH